MIPPHPLNLVEIPEHIEESFLNSDTDDFISGYDLNLIEFVEAKRNYDDLVEIDIIELEKEFIEFASNYLILKNESNQEYWLKEREKEIREEQDIKDDFLQTKNISEKEFIEFHRDYKNPLNMEYFNFKKERKTPISHPVDEEMMYFNSKIHYLTLKARKLSFIPSFLKGVKFNPPREEEYQESVDLPGHITGTEKLIMINELGILDFLEEKYTDLSENQISNILKKLTGSHLQPNINALRQEGKLNPQSTKNPYYSEKTRSRAIDRLINLGVKLPKLD